MDDRIEIACQLIEIEPEQIIRHRVEEGELVILADCGIGGIKKFRLPLVEMEQPVESEPEEDLEKMTVAELRELAEVQGVEVTKAMKKADLVTALQEAEDEEASVDQPDQPDLLGG